MKNQTLLLIFLIIASTVVRTYSQDQLITSKEAIDSLNNRISVLEKSINEQKEKQKLAEAQTQNYTNQAYKDQFKNAIQTIQTGLEMGSDIEQIVPNTLRLLAAKDLNETLNAINNPTSNSVGTPFSQMVIESASTHLLPEFPSETLKQQAKSKFKSILEAIYKGPLVQGLINSNPISSTISAAIQQAGFFEKSRDLDIEVTRKQIKNVSDSYPIKIPVNTANLDGASFTSTEMDAFNADLKKRIEFYETINQYGISQNEVTQQLYIDAKLIKKSVKASKSEICKLLTIDPNNSSADFNKKFENVSIEQIKIYFNDANFKKAISLSDYAKEQLPDVKEFQTTVVDALIKYIDGYIKILNDYKNIGEAKLDSSEITKQVSKLETIKTNLKSPL